MCSLKLKIYYYLLNIKILPQIELLVPMRTAQPKIEHLLLFTKYLRRGPNFFGVIMTNWGKIYLKLDVHT